MEIKPDGTLKDILIAAQREDKVVNMILNSGKNYKGSVVHVGDFYIRLALKEQMSFYDVMVRLEHISAIEVQVRS